MTRARVLALVDELELERDALDKPVRTLSKGMTQKLGLAGCFLLARDLYVLDEPMSGLDPAARVAVKSVLRRLAAGGPDPVLHLARAGRRRRAVLVDRGARARPGALPRRAGRAVRALRASRASKRAFMRCIREHEAAASA